MDLLVFWLSFFFFFHERMCFNESFPGDELSLADGN